MNVGDSVTLTDATGEHTGTITTVLGDGMVSVKWDMGTTERIHESELTPTEGYADDDPKHPTFRERVSSLWDSIAGK